MATMTTVPSPATQAARAAERKAAKTAAAERWAANDHLRRKLEGRLRGAAPAHAGPIRHQLADVRRQMRQDVWAVGK